MDSPKNLMVLLVLLAVLITSCLALDTPPTSKTLIASRTPFPTRTAGKPTEQSSSGPQFTDDSGRVLPTPIPPTPAPAFPQRLPTPGIPPIEGQDATPDPALLVRPPSMPYALDITSGDGNPLRGTFYPVTATNPPAVLYLHMIGGDRQLWRDLAMEAQEIGYRGLAIDLQGHGETGGQADIVSWASDLDTALSWLLIADDSPATSVAIVGASVSGNLALETAIGWSEVVGVALISPLPQIGGESLLDQLEVFEDKSWFLAVAVGDPFTLDKEAEDILALTAQRQFVTYAGEDHGTNLLLKSEQLKNDLLNWLALLLKP